jgi:heat shock protein HslJ
VRRLVVLLALSIGLGACGILPGAAPNLEATGWEAVLVAGRQPIAGREPFLRFADGAVRGSDGCNEFGGKVVVDGARISIVDLVGTDIACEAAVADVAGLFMVALGQAATIRSDGANLIIGGPGGEIVFRPSDRAVGSGQRRTPVLIGDGSPPTG